MAPQQQPAKPQQTTTPKPPQKKRHRHLEGGNLIWYLLYALLLHLLFFGLSAFTRNLDKVVRVQEIPVELMGVDQPAKPEEGGGEDKHEDPGAPEPKPELKPQPVSQPQPQAKVTEPTPEQPTETAPVNVADAIEAIETNSTQTVYRQGVTEQKQEEKPTVKPEDAKPLKRKQVSIAAVAARAAGRGGDFGTGRGKRGGRGGLGESFGTDEDLPVISGGAVFGSDKKGALKGSLCFIPVGTKRLSQVGRCKPEGVMYTNLLNITPRRFTHGFPGVSDRIEWFAIDYNGRFTVSKSGKYKFRLHSDDGSILWIDGKKVVDHGEHHSPSSRIGSIHLEEGKHRIRVLYFQGRRVLLALQLFVTPPGEEERLWGPKL